MIDFDGEGVLASEVQRVSRYTETQTTIHFKNGKSVTVEVPYQEVFELVNGNMVLNGAMARAQAIFDNWNDLVGFVDKSNSYYREMLGLLDDAVKCGFQAARNQHQELESEKYLD